MADGARDEIGLIDHSGANGARMEFDEAHHIGVLFLDEVSNARQHLPAGAQVAGPRHRKVESGPGPGGITYIVNQQSHQALYLARDASRMPIVTLHYAHVGQSYPPVRDPRVAGK